MVWSALVIAGSFGDGQREALRGVGRDPVAGRDRDRVAAAGSGGRRSGQGGGAVAVVSEGYAGREAAGLADVVAAGWPSVVTVNVPAVPTANVVWSALVIAGGWSTVSVNVCVASGADAVGGAHRDRVDATGPAAGCRPGSRSVPLSVNVTPAGRVPLSESVVAAG